MSAPSTSRRLGVAPTFGAAVVVASLSMAVAACATNPATGKRDFNLMSEQQEIAIGQQMDPEVRREFGVYENPELQQYVDEVGGRLARGSQRPNLPWHFTIVDSPVVNAFALPGGYIYLTRGLLAHLNDEAELAGVLGHEIGHVTARHAAQQYSKATGAQLGLTLSSIFVPGTRPYTQFADLGLGMLFLKYGRDAEIQADTLGARYAAQHGWDPEGVPDLLRTLARLDEQRGPRGVPSYLLTHPEPDVRVERIQDEVATLRATVPADQLRNNRDAFIRRLDGLVFGENPQEGVVRGNEFLHPEMRFALRFPEGWEIENGKTQVVAKAPGADVYMLLSLVQQPQGNDLQDLAIADMSRAGFRPVQGGVTSINGLDAHVGTYTGSIQNLGNVVARVAHVPIGRSVFRVAGLAPRQAFDAVENQFTESLRTFRELSRADANDIRPNRLDLHTVRAGETWQSLAQGLGRGNLSATKLAVLNGYSASEQPRPGDRIKVVVSG